MKNNFIKISTALLSSVENGASKFYRKISGAIEFSVGLIGRCWKALKRFLKQQRHELRMWIVKETGRMLSGRFFVFYSLSGIAYFLYLWQFVMPSSPSSAFYVTLGLLTGGDPYSFRDIIEQRTMFWMGSWIIHVSSWLIIPAIVGFVISEKIAGIREYYELQASIKDFVAEAVTDPDKRADAEIRIWEEIDDKEEDIGHQ